MNSVESLMHRDAALSRSACSDAVVEVCCGGVGGETGLLTSEGGDAVAGRKDQITAPSTATALLASRPVCSFLRRESTLAGADLDLGVLGLAGFVCKLTGIAPFSCACASARAALLAIGSTGGPEGT